MGGCKKKFKTFLELVSQRTTVRVKKKGAFKSQQESDRYVL